MTQYYKHLESRTNGRDAATQDFAERRLSEIKNQIESLQGEQRVWNRVLELCSAKVCQTCRGEEKITYYPSGTGPGQGARSSIPCPKCKPEESKSEARKLDQEYRRY